ncbi:MAG: hypothetical protein ACE5NG_06805 [bacterium]
MGTDSPVEALNSRKIDRLIMATEYEAPSGWCCGNCDFLGTGPTGEPSQYCGKSRFKKVDLKEEMVRKTLLVALGSRPLSTTYGLYGKAAWEHFCVTNENNKRE